MIRRMMRVMAAGVALLPMTTCTQSDLVRLIGAIDDALVSDGGFGDLGFQDDSFDSGFQDDFDSGGGSDFDFFDIGF